SGYNFSYRGSYSLNKYDAYVDFRNRTFSGVDPIFGAAVPFQAGESAFSFAIPFPFQEEFENTSHQVRLLSPDDQDLTWSVGAYYFWSRDSNFQQRSDAGDPGGNPDRQTRGDENIINYAALRQSPMTSAMI
ncbi:MAG: hypothetical protein RLP02_24980, partial [Coleofasciculus sp. C2-GNP5-27]